ncbi:MAG TPA: proline racemase family protein [Acidimicrobiia bacterium]
MDLRPAIRWNPPPEWRRLTVIDSHAGGEPFRVVVEGLPGIPGNTVLDRRAYAMEHLDHLRRILMWEPRGHADMYGGWLGPPVHPESDLSVLFTHNEGFSTMCGHGIIALAKVVLDTGMVAAQVPETTLRIDTPAGTVTAISAIADGFVVSTRFRNVPSFVVELGASITVPGLGEVTYDLAFGGAFYAYVDAATLELEVHDTMALIPAGRMIKEAISAERQIAHPNEPGLGFLYGVIFTAPPRSEGSHGRNVCVFADGEVDRSPTGTGVSGRLAILHHRGELGQGEPVTIESIVDSRFTGRVVATTKVGEFTAVIPEIEGTAHIIGRSELWLDPTDDLGRGFLIR